jgi:hypothetical protein
MKEELLNQLVTFVLSLVGILSSYALAKLGNYLKAKQDKLITEKGIDNYTRALNIAKGMYYVLEDEFKDIEKSGLEKKVEMDNRLLKLIPELSQEELDSINKQIWNDVKENIINKLE